MSVNLPLDVEAIVSAHISNGDYASPAEMISAAVRLFDRRKREKRRQVEKLRSMLKEAIDEADRGELLDGEEVFDEILRELDATGTISP